MPVVGRGNHHSINIFAFQRFAKVPKCSSLNTLLNPFEHFAAFVDGATVHIANMEHIAVGLLGKSLGQCASARIDPHHRNAYHFVGTCDSVITLGAKCG